MKILTFDIEDWYHILDNAETATEKEWITFPSRLETGLSRILDMLDRNQQKATFFILGWIARNYPDCVAEIARRGHEIATHSDMHGLVFNQSKQEFENDLRQSLDSIEAATGIRPTAYRAPGFSITESCQWAFEILARNGISTDCSIFPAPRSHGGLPSFPQGFPCQLEVADGHLLKVFPISFGNIAGRRFIFSGGGYFRLLPKPLLDQLFRKSDYVMTYFHPRDFDPDQPMVPGLSMQRQIKSYVGLRHTLAKLEAIIRTHDFVTLSQAAGQVDWNQVPKVPISVS